mgnify:FL=1
MTRVLFWGDAQLESGLTLGHGEYGPGSRAEDQEGMLKRIVDIADEESCDIVVNLGDSFERPYPAPWAIVALKSLVDDLDELDKGQVVLLGNHDMKSPALPTILGVFGSEHVHVSQTPELIAVDDIVFATLPWSPISRLVASMDGVPRGELRQFAIDALVLAAITLRERCAGEHPEKTPILLVHWSVSGSLLPGAAGRVDDLPNDPVIPWQDLDALGFTIVACGHIHRPQMIGAEQGATTPMFYVGSPMINNFGEEGTPHGCFLFDTVARELRFIVIPDRPFLTFDVDLAVADDWALLAKASQTELDGAIIRVRFKGTAEQIAAADVSGAQRKLLELGARKVFPKTDVVRSSRARVELIDETVSDVEALELWIGALGPDEIDPDLLSAIREQHLRYLEEASL